MFLSTTNVQIITYDYMSVDKISIFAPEEFFGTVYLQEIRFFVVQIFAYSVQFL